MRAQPRRKPAGEVLQSASVFRYNPQSETGFPRGPSPAKTGRATLRHEIVDEIAGERALIKEALELTW